MEKLQIKTVAFMTDELVAAKDEETGKIYVGVSYICKGIGLTEDQMKNERKRIQRDMVLAKGGSNLTLPTSGGLQETLCIDIDFLPLWLAKISITPAMQQNAPEVVDKLVGYQLRAKDVLAKAFLHSQPESALDAFKACVAAMEEQQRRMDAMEASNRKIENTVTAIRDAVQYRPDHWRRDINRMLNRIAERIGSSEAFREIRSQLYAELQERGGCNLNTRLENYRANLEKAGANRSAITEANKLDVIDQDKRLREIFFSIVRDALVRYCAEASEGKKTH